MHLTPQIAFAFTALTAFGVTAARPAAAQGLDGTKVTGSLVFGGGSPNYFDPANNTSFYGVPPGFGNAAGTTVAVSESQVEFGYKDNPNMDTADFTNGQLILTDVSQSFGSNATYTFMDSSFSSVSKIFDTFDGGLSYTLAGSTLTINEPAFSTAGIHEAIFNIKAAPAVPEASTTVSLGLLLALGLGGMVAHRRKRSLSSSH